MNVYEFQNYRLRLTALLYCVLLQLFSIK